MQSINNSLRAIFFSAAPAAAQGVAAIAGTMNRLLWRPEAVIFGDWREWRQPKPALMYQPWRQSDFRTGRLGDERFPSFCCLRLTMPRRELLHSSLCDPAKWRESLIYTKMGTALSSPENPTIGWFYFDSLQTEFWTNEVGTLLTGIGQQCLSISSFPRTCDVVVWPTSVTDMGAPDTGELSPHFIWHFKMWWASSWWEVKFVACVVTPFPSYTSVTKSTARWLCSLPPFHVAYFQKAVIRWGCASMITHDWLGTLTRFRPSPW